MDVETGTKSGMDNPALQLDDEFAKTSGGRNGHQADGGDASEKESSPAAPADKGHLDEDEGGVVFEDLPGRDNVVSKVEKFVRRSVGQVCGEVASFLPDGADGYLLKIVLLVLYNVYFFYAVYHHLSQEETPAIDWCGGLGCLIVLTLAFYLGLFYFKLVKPAFASKFGVRFTELVFRPLGDCFASCLSHRLATPVLYGAVVAAFAIFMVVDTADDPQRLISGAGLVILVLLGFVFSSAPSMVVWRHVVWGLVLQLLFGLVILRWEVGRSIFECLGEKVSSFLGYSDAGSSFVFGYLASSELSDAFATYKLDPNSTAYEVATVFNEKNAVNWTFMFHILSVIYFFSFFISMLFHLGWMQWVVIKIGWALQVTVGTTACESLNAAANIFLGQSEAPLMIKPYLPLMTPSELHAAMTGGFATIAGTVLAAYISFGVPASHLLTASVMSAPAALAMAKLMMPETKKTKTLPQDIKIEKGGAANILDAASEGAVTAVFLVANIAGTLVAVLAFIAFVNGVFGWLGGLVGVEDLTIEWVLGKLFIPLAFIMGVPTQDLEKVGTLIGLKTFVNEFAAYDRMGKYGDDITERSRIIATYALCGFANPASVGIQIAALSTMAPERRGDLARVAGRAFVAGSMACFLTACIAGMLIA